MKEMFLAAKAAKNTVARLGTEQKNAALEAMAASLEAEQDKIHEAHEVIAHLYDIMLDYEQEFICGTSDSYSLAQVRDASNLMAMLSSSKEFRLENL